MQRSPEDGEDRHGFTQDLEEGLWSATLLAIGLKNSETTHTDVEESPCNWWQSPQATVLLKEVARCSGGAEPQQLPVTQR